MSQGRRANDDEFSIIKMEVCEATQARRVLREIKKARNGIEYRIREELNQMRKTTSHHKSLCEK